MIKTIVIVQGKTYVSVRLKAGKEYAHFHFTYDDAHSLAHALEDVVRLERGLVHDEANNPIAEQSD